MSYKVNEIHQIESTANQCGLNKYTYLSGFEYKGEKYSLGWVILNEEGMEKFNTKNPKVEITQHWIEPNGTEGYAIKCYREIKSGKLSGFYKWESIFKYNISFDDYLEDTDIDYKNTTVDEILYLPQDQMFEHLQTKQIIEGTYTPSEKPKPLFKDWEAPELIVGWIVFILFLLVVFVFKDWYIQLILRVVGLIVFNGWRQQKLFGIK